MSFSDLRNCPHCNTKLRGIRVASDACWSIGYCDSCNGVPTQCNSCGTSSVVQPSTEMECPSCGEYNASQYLSTIL
jgi:hypothetical protein